MKTAKIIFILFLAMCLPFIAGSEDRTIKRNKPSEERIALVIGNGNYRNVGTLKNPVNDARDMAAALKKLGFRVVHRENAEKKKWKMLSGSSAGSCRKTGSDFAEFLSDEHNDFSLGGTAQNSPEIYLRERMQDSFSDFITIR